MICLDTTFLIDLWRNHTDQSHGTIRLLTENAGEVFVVPAMAAGEFLEGAAYISDARYHEAMVFLSAFEFGVFSRQTASQYARLVANLRHTKRLKGHSQADLWIAAYAIESHAPLATHNRQHFVDIDGLTLVAY